MQKMNDSEKATLRLEVEKLHRGETEWLQVLVRILDHVFALHTAAVRTGDPKFAEPITNFQNACRDIVRRIGLTPFIAEPDEQFNAERHQFAGGKEIITMPERGRRRNRRHRLHVSGKIPAPRHRAPARGERRRRQIENPLPSNSSGRRKRGSRASALIAALNLYGTVFCAERKCSQQFVTGRE